MNFYRISQTKALLKRCDTHHSCQDLKQLLDIAKISELLHFKSLNRRPPKSSAFISNYESKLLVKFPPIFKIAAKLREILLETQEMSCDEAGHQSPLRKNLIIYHSSL